MENQLGQAAILIVNTLGGLFLLALLLRFLLQASRADYYNPVSQALVRLTDPALRPLRGVMPSLRGLDLNALAVAIIFNALACAVMILADNLAMPAVGTLLSWSLLGIFSFILNIYFYGLLISVIASWVAPYSGNPALLLIHQLLEPIQARCRRFLPPMGGLDFTPILILLGIQVIKITAVSPLAVNLRLGAGAARYVIGI